MKLITHNVYDSIIIVNIPDSSSITTTKVNHILEHREDDTDTKHELRGYTRLITDSGVVIADWNERDKKWSYGQ